MKDYKKIVETLRFCSKSECSKCTFEWNTFCFDEMCVAAADAIEELQQIADHYEQTAKDYWKQACDYKAQLPKRGEWKATEMYMTDECTACGFLMNWEDVPECLFNLPHFQDICPNCGAKMGGVNDAVESRTV